MDPLENLFLSRRDTRHFTSDLVPDDVLAKSLAAGNAAPSVGLTDATRYYVIRSKEVKQAVKDLFESYHKKSLSLISSDEQKEKYLGLKLEGILETPIGLVIAYDRSVLNTFTIGTVASNETIKLSSACAAQNIWLSLTSQGYSMGWVSILNYDAFKKILGLPDHIEPLGYFCVGKPADDYDKQPMLQQKGWKEKQKLPQVFEIEKIAERNVSSENETSRTFTSSEKLKQVLQYAINHKTKPEGSLGVLETLALQIGELWQTTTPQISKPQIVVFAADHGIATHGVSAYPQGVTRQMVENFLRGGAAINVFSKQNGLELTIVDAGVNYDFADHPKLVNAKVGKGTASFFQHAAMSLEEVALCFEHGKKIIFDLIASGSNTIGFGEMGIGNTSSASMLMHLLTGLALEDCIGRGTGIGEKKYLEKKSILKEALSRYEMSSELEDILAYFGGFEILQMAGGMIVACQNNVLILVDGFISSVAFLIAERYEPTIKKSAIFCHCSAESGHRKLLDYLGVRQLLQLDMRLGEGSACAVAFPIVKSALIFLNEMASFEEAGVSTRSH